MTCNSSFDCLSEDLIERILGKSELSFKDVSSFSLTCKKFHWANWSQGLWKTKMFQRWPRLEKLYADDMEFRQDSSWLDAIKASLNQRKIFMQNFTGIPERNFHKKDCSPSDLFPDKLLWDANDNNRLPNLIDEMLEIINSSQTDLTQKYYAKKALCYLQQAYARHKWDKILERIRPLSKDLLEKDDYKYNSGISAKYSLPRGECSKPTREEVLEKAAVIFAEWFQPEHQLLYSKTLNEFDNIVRYVEELLKMKDPTHPLFIVPEKVRQEWKFRRLNDNQFEVEESRTIIACLCRVMFAILGFCKKGSSRTDTRYLHQERFFINKVLQNRIGHPSIFLIIFESVARRLGVKCEIAFTYTEDLSNDNKGFYSLRWREQYNKESKDSKCFELNIYKEDELLTREKCLEMGEAAEYWVESEGVNDEEKDTFVDERIDVVMKNLINTIVEPIVEPQGDVSVDRGIEMRLLELVISFIPNEIDWALQPLIERYLQRDMHTAHLMAQMELYEYDARVLNGTLDDLIEELQSFIAKTKKEISVRQGRKLASLKPKRRLHDDIFVVGLICYVKKVEEYCVITGWSHIAKPAEPNYLVLFDGGKYVEKVHQCDLRITSPVKIDNPEIGRHFKDFDGYSYIPNEKLAQMFADDNRRRQEIVAKYFKRKK